MGMPIVVDVRDECADEVLDELFDWFREVDERFSTYKADSEISRLNRGELAVARLPSRRALGARPLRRAARGDRRLLRRALRARCSTVDPSGLVKGWSVDRGGELLEARGLAQLLDQRRRRHPDARRGAARARLADRASSIRVLLDRIAAVVEANDLALATSGTYVRGEHIVDPHTRPRRRRGSSRSRSPATTSRTADAYATAAFAMGELGRGLDGDAAAPTRRSSILADERVALDARLPARDLTLRDAPGVRHRRDGQCRALRTPASAPRRCHGASRRAGGSSRGTSRGRPPRAARPRSSYRISSIATTPMLAATSIRDVARGHDHRAQRLGRLRRDLARLPRRHVEDERGELVAAEPADHVGRAQPAAQHVGGRPQHLVAGEVAGGVVHES